MKIIIISVLLLAVLTGIASAGYEELEPHVEFYNKHVEEVPGFLNPIFGNQKINLHITNSDETVVGVRTEGMTIAEFNKEPFDKPSMDVYINQSLVDQGLAAKDPIAVFNDAWDAGEVRYKAHTTGMKIKMFVLKLLI